jgi:cholesterol oxidase
VIGSGFGGSVSALRLVEKGYRVLLCEKGRVFRPADFPRNNWNFARWLWLPALRWRGFFQMTFFRHVTVLSGVGFGGGSLVYANTLPTPPRAFFANERWAHLAAWESELAPHYDTVRKMLGATTNRTLGPADFVLRDVVTKRGEAEKFQPTTVAVYFGKPGERAADPYFGGDGPERTGCLACGACMTGCRHGAKNTLDTNYLYFAQKKGLQVRTECEVVHLGPSDDGYLLRVHEKGKSAEVRAKQVICAGGVLGTMDLLARMKRDPTGLPYLSPRLGEGVSTNSESLIGVNTGQVKTDYSSGVAIGSIYQVDEQSHAEMVRYGAGSGAFRLLTAPHVGVALPGAIKVVVAALKMLSEPWRSLRALFVRDWAKATMILLYMRVAEEPLKLRWSPWKRWLKIGPALASDAGAIKPTANLAPASALADEVAKASGGVALSLVTETALGIPTTAHILGGACMGVDIESGVIDAMHRVHAYPGLYVIDGSAMSANPGVNPSLTIAAMAERAMQNIPACENR